MGKLYLEIHMPDWLDTEVWEAFLEMRKEIKKPMTDYAKKMAIKRLEKMREEGQDPTAVLEQSIFCNWQGLFPVKEEFNETSRGVNTNTREARKQSALDEAFGTSGNVVEGDFRRIN